MKTRTDTTLRLTRVVNADSDTVFNAWTEREQMLKWASPEGVRLEDVEVDLTVGGRYKLSMRSDEGSHTAVGVYREIDAPRRLVYTWGWEEDTEMGETLVTVEFNDLGGSTEVVVSHEQFPAAEATEAHEQGWTSCLDRFQQLFA